MLRLEYCLADAKVAQELPEENCNLLAAPQKVQAVAEYLQNLVQSCEVDCPVTETACWSR